MDEAFLTYIGGVHNNSLDIILKSDGYDGDELPTIQRSSYYNCTEFSKICEANKNNFSVLSSNIESIHAKFHELEIFIEEVKQFDFKFSVLCFQECWLSNNDDVSHIQLDGYRCIAQGNTCTSKGGLIMYVDTKYNCNVVMELNTYRHWEGQLVNISGGELAKHIIIGNIYRPPRTLLN